MSRHEITRPLSARKAVVLAIVPLAIVAVMVGLAWWIS